MKPWEAAARPFRSDRFLHGYARGKARHDPAYHAVAAALAETELPVLDIGCGIGLMSAFLREKGLRQPIVGLDPDARKIAIANACVAPVYPGLEFAVGSAESAPRWTGSVIVLDVLHYLGAEMSSAFLGRLADDLPAGGVLLIRTTFRDRSLRYLVTLAEEGFIRATGWIRGGHCVFPTRPDVCLPLERAGLDVRVSPMWGRTPFNSYFVEARRLRG